MYIYERNLSDTPPPAKPPSLVDDLKKYISEKGSSKVEVEERIDKERSDLGRTVVIIGENHSAETRSVDLLRRLMKKNVYRFIASEFFLNAGEFRIEIRNFMRGLRNSLGGFLCPYETLLRDLRAKPRFMLFVGSRREGTNIRDQRIALHFLEEHADRKLNRTMPGILVCGTHHAARVAEEGQHKTVRRRLEEAGFKILGVLLATDDIDRANSAIQLRTGTVWPVGETQTFSNAIRLLDLVSTTDEYTVLPTTGSPFERVTDDWNFGGTSSVSIAQRYELVVLAKSMQRPCPTPAADRRFKLVAALVTDGLKLANDAIPQLKQAQQDLLRFLTSLLETNFFPRGHGIVDEQGNVLRQSKIGTVAIPVSARDGSSWPRFEYRVKLSLDDRILDPNLRGRHLTAHFSDIFLFTHALQGTTPSRAVLTALHEMIHMMFAMIRNLERLRGADTVRQFLSRQPWRMLDLGGFAGHRGNLERHARDLLRVLPIPMQAAELATSLIEEAFAFMFGVIVDEAIARSIHAKTGKRGPAVLPTVNFSPEAFVTVYVLERGFNVTREQLKARGAQQIFLRMTSDVDALAVALRMHLGS